MNTDVRAVNLLFHNQRLVGDKRFGFLLAQVFIAVDRGFCERDVIGKDFVGFWTIKMLYPFSLRIRFLGNISLRLEPKRVQ